MKTQCVTVFCGSRNGSDPQFLESVHAFGKLMGKNGMRLIYGGSSAGCMGALADTVLEHGGTVVGVIPEFLGENEVAHTGLTELIYVKSMHERKQIMADLADVFLALPGGIGTLDELVEIISWKLLSLHDKPIFIYSNNDFFKHLTDLFDEMEVGGFLRDDFSEMYAVVGSPEEFLKVIRK